MESIPNEQIGRLQKERDAAFEAPRQVAPDLLRVFVVADEALRAAKLTISRFRKVGDYSKLNSGWTAVQAYFDDNPRFQDREVIAADILAGGFSPDRKQSRAKANVMSALDFHTNSERCVDPELIIRRGLYGKKEWANWPEDEEPS